MVDAVAHVIEGAVVEEILDLLAVHMGGGAELQAWVFHYVALKHVGHVVVKLAIERGNVHADDGAVKLLTPMGHLVGHELEIGHRTRVVKLQGIGVEADKLDASGYEAEVGVAKHLAKGLFARSDAVMIAQQGYVGYTQTVHDVALPQKLVGYAKVAHVAAMNHKIHVIALIQVADEVARGVIPTLRIAHRDEANRGLALAVGLNAGDVGGVDIGLSADAHVVGVVINHIAPLDQPERGQQAEGREQTVNKSLHTVSYDWQKIVGKNREKWAICQTEGDNSMTE